MLVKDLQQFLSKFTEANATVIFVEMHGKLHEIKRMEVQENSVPIVGHSGRTAHRLVMKTQKVSNLILPQKLQDDY